MPDLPNLTPEQVAAILPVATNVEHVGSGGQKIVFRATLEGETYALKFALVPADIDSEEVPFAEVTVRASREVETMRDCASPHMVKLGPIGLTFREIEGQNLLYFSEEFIVGRDLKQILRDDGPFSPSEIIKLGLHITNSIKELWDLGKIHRDIKPGNIMRRNDTGDYVLLDAGFAFDVVGESISAGLPVGTPTYFSPEQFDYRSRRTVLDFRSDIFALGVTMYELATGQHPFWSVGESSQTLYTKVKAHDPPSPSSIAQGIPEDLGDIILRMLGKSPHLRYRKCDNLTSALQDI